MAVCADDSECRPNYACMGDDDPRLIDDEGQVLARTRDTDLSDGSLYCVAITAPELK